MKSSLKGIVVAEHRCSIRPSQRFRILSRDQYTCRYCGRSAPDVVLEVDHVIPVAAGGKNDDTNLVTACRDCNVGKSDSADDIPVTELVKTCPPLELDTLAEQYERSSAADARRARFCRLLAQQMRLAGLADDAPLTRLLAV